MHGLLSPVVVGLFLYLTSSLGEEIFKEAVHDNVAAIYPYHLVAASAFGRIHDSALPGSQIPIDYETHHGIQGVRTKDKSGFLKLELYENLQYGREGNATLASERMKLGTKLDLPQGVKIDISSEHVTGSDVALAFSVDENLEVTVGENSEILKDYDEIEFYAVAVNHSGKHDVIVSNPLPFVITIDHTEPEGEGATVYVGIIFGVIVLFVLLIPFTVRTKRRLREGKPVCGCGPYRKKNPDDQESGSGSDDAGKDNLAFALGEGRPRSQRRETFQSHELRSFSSHHFQPHWLDPHYKGVYEHPDYEKQRKISQQVEANSTAAVPGTSSGSQRRVSEKL